MWDRDTLRAEQVGLPDAVQIVTGRFERNPPLFYKMRIERVQRDLKSHPENLGLYDDAAVASDRLGDDVAAIAWMRKKRAVMATLQPSSDDRYRTEANEGTFHVHLWLTRGARADDLSELMAGRKHLAEGLAINPDAHFGRERMQIGVVDWLIATRTGKESENLAVYLDDHVKLDDPEKRLKGLLGLVALGNAWQSVDMFDAIALQANGPGHYGSTGRLAMLRATELLKSGQHAMRPGLKAQEDLTRPDWSFHDDDARRLESSYALLRREADDWQSKRTAYMTTRLRAGKHPDTDPTFWNDWHDSGPPPALAPNAFSLWLRNALNSNEFFFTCVLAFVALIVVVIVRFEKRRASR